jgi:hypothetical protein
MPHDNWVSEVADCGLHNRVSFLGTGKGFFSAPRPNQIWGSFCSFHWDKAAGA